MPSFSFFHAAAKTVALYPARVFWLCMGIHLLAWTIVPTLVDPTQLVDTLEGYAWGHEWPLGTYKHPPLQAWILEILAVVTGRAPWASFLANQIAVVAACWAVWQTGRRVVGETGALIGALSLLMIPYYNFLNPAFNPNILQLPFWALIGLSFYKAVKDNRTLDWLALGLWSAAGLYTKYSTAMLLIALAGLMISHPESRKRLTAKGPWLTVLVTTVLFAPHFVWLVTHDFMPFAYAQSRFEKLPSGAAFLIAPILFLFWQAATLLPALAAYGISFGFRRPQHKEKARLSFDAIFIHVITFGPAVLTLLLAGIMGGVLRTMWATPFWNFIGLWVVFCFCPVFSPKALRRYALIAVFLFLAGLGGFIGVDFFGPYLTHTTKRIDFPGQTLALHIAKTWQERTHTPLRYVVGDTWVGGNLAYYAPDRPHLFIDGNYAISPWIHEEEIKKYGGVIVWCTGGCTDPTSAEVPAYLQTEFPEAEIQPEIVLPQVTGAAVVPAKIGWAILPPH